MKRPRGLDRDGRNTGRGDMQKLFVDGAENPQEGLFRAPKKSDEDLDRARVIAVASDLAESVWDADREAATEIIESEDLSHIVKDPLAEKVARLEAEAEASDSRVKTSRSRVRLAREQLRWKRRTQRVAERKERRRFTADKRRTMLSWLVPIGSLVLLAIVVGLLVFTPVMSVREIEITGLQRVDRYEVQESLKSLADTPIALVRDEQIAGSLQKFSLVESYSYEILPPSTLKIKLQERTPVVAIPDEKVFGLYDSAGVLIENVPRVPAGIPVAVDGVVDVKTDVYRNAATIVKYLPEKLRNEIVEVGATGQEDVHFKLKSGLRVVWGSRADYSLKSVVLERMVQALSGKVSLVDISAPNTPVYR